MSKVTRISLTLFAGLVLIVIVFRGQISDFLFNPEGLSTAASEFCLQNKGSTALVADLAVKGGARSTTWLEPGDSACSASPAPGLETIVQVSAVDGKPPYCRYEGKAGQVVTLLEFAPPDNCRWTVQ
jgi:hypothetical protein